MTLKLVMGLGPGGTSTLAQVVLVPLAKAGWLYQTCSIGSRRGQNKPLLVPWQKSYTSIGPFLVPWHKLYTTMELVPVSLVPTCAKKWVYKAVKLFSLFMIDKVHQSWFCLFNGDGVLIRQPGTSSTEAIDQL